MKRKCNLIWILLITMIVFSGCSSRQDLSGVEGPEQSSRREETEGERTKEKDVEKNESEAPDTGELSGTTEGSSASEGMDGLRIDTEKVNRMLEELSVTEKILDIMLPNDETLLLQCMNRESEEYVYYILEYGEGEEILRPITIPLVGTVDCYTYEDSVVLYDTGNHVIVMNRQLETLNEITVPEEIHPIRNFGDKRNYCILPRSQKIIYYKQVTGDEFYVGLFEADYTGKEEQLVYRLDGPETNLNFLNGFSEICPGYSQKGVFFTGVYYESIESQSKDCVGYLDLESKEITVRKTESNRMELSSDGAVFFDGYRENDSEYAGKLLFIDETGDVSWLVTKKGNESERVTGGTDGYILTCYGGDNGEGILNFYKKKIWEKQFVVPKEPEEFVPLNQGKYILLSYRTQNGYELSFLDAEQGKQVVKEESPFSPEMLESLGETLQVFYSWTVTNYDSSLKRIDFKEENYVDLTMGIESTHDCEVGYMIFVDGIPQKYRMGDEEGYVIPVDCDKGISSATLEFSPVVPEEKEDYNVIFACMFHPGFRASEECMDYGNYHRVSQLLPWKISGDFLKQHISISNEVLYRPLTEEIKERHTRINHDGTIVRQYETALFSKFYQNGTETLKFLGRENTQLVLYGRDECMYRVSLYVDHQPVAAFSGAEYADVVVKKDQMTVIDLDFSEVDLADYSCIYAILWSDSAKDDGRYMIEKTDSVTFIR